MEKRTRSPLLSARLDWIALEILVIFGLTLIYTIIIFVDESSLSRTILETWKATVKEVTPCIHVVMLFVVGAFELGGEIMLRYTAKIQEALDKGIVQGKAEGIAEGKAEGKAEGIVEGQAEIYQAWYADWERRKKEASEKGLPFSDPPPPKPEDI